MEELIQIARDTIERHYEKGVHTVGAALRTKTGHVYTGISIKGQKLDLCSEWGALIQAFLSCDREIEEIVAVHRDADGNFEVYPPCGLCRELFLTHCPEARILLSENESKIAKDLLPNAWQRKN